MRFAVRFEVKGRVRYVTINAETIEQAADIADAVIGGVFFKNHGISDASFTEVCTAEELHAQRCRGERDLPEEITLEEAIVWALTGGQK